MVLLLLQVMQVTGSKLHQCCAMSPLLLLLVAVLLLLSRPG
jgi:hypothetical protein